MVSVSKWSAAFVLTDHFVSDYAAPSAGPLGRAFLAILMLVLTGCMWLPGRRRALGNELHFREMW